MSDPETAVDKSLSCQEMQEIDWDSGSRNHRDVVFNGGKNHPNFKNFANVAAQMDKFNFIQLLDCHSSFDTKHGDIGFPSGNGKKESIGFEKWDQNTDLKTWIESNFLPPVFKMSDANNAKSLTKLGHNLILWTNREIPQAYHDAAAIFKGKFHFMVSDDDGEN
jgi:hypothetical protein